MTYPWGDTRRFNSYAGYFRRLFGCRVQKLSVDAGFTCPNRDGTIGEGGCTFCNNGAFTPSYCMPSKSVGQQIAEGIEFHRNRYRSAQRYLVYFQAFSNTYAPLERLKRLYDEALAHPGVAGIVVGTRPDCVDERKLDYFAGLARDRYVALEYGIGSTLGATLRAGAPPVPAAGGLIPAKDEIPILGRLLFSDYLLAFESLSVLLLLAAVGALVLSQRRFG